MKIAYLFLFSAALLLQSTAFAQTNKISNEITSPATLPVSQRTVAISKLTCQSAAQAVMKAERANPGWKAVNVKEHKHHYGVTLKKK